MTVVVQDALQPAQPVVTTATGNKEGSVQDDAGAREAVPVDTPPDGGLLAWFQVAGSFALFVNTWGLMNAYGAFQTYYERELLHHLSSSTISWVGSVQSFFLLVVGVVSGPLYDAGWLRPLLATGTFLVFLGFMTLSACTEYWQVFLAQGVCVGLGTGCLYIPSIALLPQYFVKRRALAIGIATAGSSFGGTIYPLVFQALLPRLGFGWTTRVLGFISLATCSFSLSSMRPRGKAREIRKLLDLDAFKDRRYVIYCAAFGFSNIAFFGPVFYIQSYALSHGMAGQVLAFYLVSILNAGSVVGRIAPSFVADWIGPLNALLLAVVGTAITVFSWISVRDTAGNLAFSVAYGLFSGGIVALPAVVLTSFTSDLSRLGTRLGMSAVINGFGSLIGPPISGAILNATGKYLGVQLFSAFTITGTALCLCLLRVALVGWKFPVKV